MFLDGDFFAQCCANGFAFNMGIMMAAVWHMMGMVVVGISASTKTSAEATADGSAIFKSTSYLKLEAKMC